MNHVHGFAPVAAPDATRLVLGSMPGVASLKAQQYYGHPRNAFWPIMRHLLHLPADSDYAAHCRALTHAGIALWDVLKTCTRSGSLDSAIVESSIVTNDFGAFFDTHPNVETLYFNGAKALASYEKHVLPDLAGAQAALPRIRLPSTSPAHAALKVEDKLRRWRCVVA